MVRLMQRAHYIQVTRGKVAGLIVGAVALLAVAAGAWPAPPAVAKIF